MRPHVPLLSLLLLARLVRAADAPKKPANVLFIITDQQRWDTLGSMGNKIIELKNLLANEADRAANEEVAERLKQSLVNWLERVKSPHLEEVRARPVGGGQS